MHGEEMKYIQEAFDTNWVAPLGKNVDEFEREMAAYLGVNSAATLVSGTAALHFAVKLAGVKPGDIVFCSDLTFAATVNPVSYEGGKQVFIDSEWDTWNMDPRALEKAFDKYPECKVVIVVNLYGTPAKLDEIAAICKKHGATLIEDAAESLSATYQGKQTGTFGKYSILSFNGNKIITSSGGGMLLSNDEEATAKARFWATQSREQAPWYEHEEIGNNYRISPNASKLNRHGKSNRIWCLFKWVCTFSFINLTWVVFRADSLSQAISLWKRVFAFDSFNISGGFVTNIVDNVVEIKTVCEVADIFHLASTDLVGYLLVILLFIITMLVVLFTKNSGEVKFVPNARKGIFTVVLLAWSIVSLVGESQFLYFNF